jgi:2'-5' RNA ligase
MLRLFVGLDLPPALKRQLAFLAGGLPGARWVPADSLHLTLRFIGETAPHQADEIDHALYGVQARGFTLRVHGLGLHHRNGRPTTLWAGAERAPPLAHLQSKIETALQRAGLDPERRRFAPHVTLARLDPNIPEARLAAYIQAHNLFLAETAYIDHFVLFQSLRGKTHAVYHPEVRYDLDPDRLGSGSLAVGSRA